MKIHEATAPKEEDGIVNITEEDLEIIENSALGKTMSTEETNEE